MRRRDRQLPVLATVLALVAAAALLSAPADGSPGQAEPSGTAWYRTALTWANGEGVVTQGPSTFRPNDPVNRAQEAAALWRLGGAPADAPPSGAPDVRAGAWYRPAVDWALDRGRVPLLFDGSFRPKQAVTRAALAMALWRTAGEPAAPASSAFVDVPADATYRPAVDWAAGRGILRGFRDGTFQPRAKATRGQFVAALYRLATTHDAEPPNFVVVMTDDQTLESVRVMPRTTELLGDAGTTFANAFATFPLCCPSRATVLTGQYAHNHGVVNNIAFRPAPAPPVGGHAALDHTNTLPVWLRTAGYATAHVGKYLNCYGSTHSLCRTDGPTVPPGWDRWFATIDPFPDSADYFEYDVSDGGTVRHIGSSPTSYETDVLADRAVADLERFGERQQPFFLNVWPHAPHSGTGLTWPGPFSPSPAPRHVGMFAAEAPPATPAVGEADLSDKPQYVRDLAANYNPIGNPTVYRATLQSLQAVDELVERLVDTLDAMGELDRTVIVFTSDNGFTFGEHRLNFRKVVPYEESVRVPLLIRGPGFPAGAVAEQLVGNVDLAPTLVAMAGVEPGLTMDGRSVLPLAQDPGVARDRVLLLEDWPGGTFIGHPPTYAAVRTPDDVYISYDTGEREYYDLLSDPHQLDSRHDDPATLTRRQALAGVLAALRTCRGPSCEQVAPG